MVNHSYKYFTPKELDRLNSHKDERTLYGKIESEFRGTRYFTKVCWRAHRKNTSSCILLEVYREIPNTKYATKIGEIDSIKSASNYYKFVKRCNVLLDEVIKSNII